ncbi:hypothetical protein Ocin01_16081 [Orchesella cincta]|uniref:Uncharacterized protein n=1 Tax=Orchesella cincta TaxID=48709 RepID=A0A1D2MC77_ORCCI|nr:hypothetical protein Ocin01_16081 [Orchesella cincta]
MRHKEARRVERRWKRYPKADVCHGCGESRGDFSCNKGGLWTSFLLQKMLEYAQERPRAGGTRSVTGRGRPWRNPGETEKLTIPGLQRFTGRVWNPNRSSPQCRNWSPIGSSPIPTIFNLKTVSLLFQKLQSRLPNTDTHCGATREKSHLDAQTVTSISLRKTICSRALSLAPSTLRCEAYPV